MVRAACLERFVLEAIPGRDELGCIRASYLGWIGRLRRQDDRLELKMGGREGMRLRRIGSDPSLESRSPWRCCALSLCFFFGWLRILFFFQAHYCYDYPQAQSKLYKKETRPKKKGKKVKGRSRWDEQGSPGKCGLPHQSAPGGASMPVAVCWQCQSVGARCQTGKFLPLSRLPLLFPVQHWGLDANVYTVVSA